VIVGFEHILLAVNWIINWGLDGMPTEVKKAEEFKTIMKERSLNDKEGAGISLTNSKNKTVDSENGAPLYDKCA